MVKSGYRCWHGQLVHSGDEVPNWLLSCVVVCGLYTHSAAAVPGVRAGRCCIGVHNQSFSGHPARVAYPAHGHVPLTYRHSGRPVHVCTTLIAHAAMRAFALMWADVSLHVCTS